MKADAFKTANSAGPKTYANPTQLLEMETVLSWARSEPKGSI